MIRFSVTTIKFTDKLKEKRVSFSIISQLIRCVTSIGANVVEAKSAHSKRDYVKFFEIALKSANEAKYWFVITKEIEPETRKEIDKFLKENIEIANIIASSILTMKNKR